MLSGPTIILILKVAVIAVTLILLTSLGALALGSYRWHGRLNTAFFILTTLALVGLELVVRVIEPTVFDYMDTEPALKQALIIHLSFSLPATLVMPLMLITGHMHRRRWHLGLAAVFGVLWIGTFTTGVFFLPHNMPVAQ